MFSKSKKIISLLICVVMLVALAPQLQLPAAALNAARAVPAAVTPEMVAQGTCGNNISWTLDSNGLLNLEGTGAMDDYASASGAPWYSRRSAIKTIRISDGITTIGDRAFYGCTALFDVTMGKDVTTVGTYAFRGCTTLGSIFLPAGVTELKGSAFRACTALTLVQLGGNAPTVGSYVFNDGAGTITIQYPEGTTGYDVSPWNGFTQTTTHAGTWVVTQAPTCTTEGSRYIDCTYCKTTVTEQLPAAHQYVRGICSACGETQVRCEGDYNNYNGRFHWELDVFGTLTISGTGTVRSMWSDYKQNIKAVVIRKGITSLGDNAFSGCSSLESITIPESVTSIGYSAFSGCSSLTSVTIPDSVTSIGSYAFSYCSSLTSVTIPDSVTSIGHSVFSGCSSLTSVTICEGVTSIGDYAFEYCSSLTSVTIPDSMTSIDNYAFSNCSSLTSVIIPESVTSIGGAAFTNCSSLTSVTIPESVTSIGSYAFYGCSSLESVTIPESVTSIGEAAFYNCSSLTSVTIPDRVTSIGRSAFSGCSSLRTIVFLGSAPTMNSDSFSSVSATVYYPCNNATWTDEIKQSLSGDLNWKGHLYTCAPNGTTSCTLCGAKDTEYAPAFPHSFGSDGLCTRCGNGPDIIIDMTGSPYYWSNRGIAVYADDTLLTTATVSSGSTNQVKIPHTPGTTYTFKWIGYSNSSCGFAISVDGEVWVSGNGGNYSNGATIYTMENTCIHQYETVTVQPTCTQDGGITTTCSLCGKNTTEVLPATGHQRVNGVCTLCGSGSGATLSGNITSFADGAVTLTLTGNGMEETLTTDTGNYTLIAAPGQYTLTVSKKNHVTRQYSVTLGSGNVTLDVKIHLIGDIDGNGKINVGDVSKLSAHLKGSNPITDEYILLCANVNGGSLNMGDTASLYAHIKGTKLLY